MITPELHQQVFDFLMDWSNSENSFNKCFATRFRRDNKFNDGYYFQGNTEYMAITFWTGSDYMNKTPNIFFEISEREGIRIFMTAKDSDVKADFFKRISFMMNGWNKGKKFFSKRLSFNTNDWRDNLDIFLREDKLLIDEELKKELNEIEQSDEEFIYDEYSSKFGFISPKQFDRMVSNVREVEKRRDRLRALNKFLSSPPETLGIESIYIRNFHGIKSLEIVNLPSEAKWIFITGENGFGKSSLLQAIALGLTTWRENIKYFDIDSSIQVGFIKDGVQFVNSTLSEKESDLSNINQFVLGYGPSRLNFEGENSQSDENKKGVGFYSLFNSDGLLLNIEIELNRANSFRDKSYLNSIISALKKATNNHIAEIIINEGFQVRYKEKLEDGYLTELISIDQLSAGFRSIINLVGDIVVRLNKSVQNSIVELRGIVLIDEFENHLHPKMQKALPGLLSNVFPNIQFIVSTHSPIPLLGAPKKSVILNVSRSSSDGTLVRRLDEKIYLQDLQPNALLSSPIFGLEDIFHGESDNSSIPSIDETFNEKIKREKLSNYVDEFLDTQKEKELIELMKKRHSK